MVTTVCDRCKKHVALTDDVIELQSIIQNDQHLPFTIKKCRHIRCSPSSAQWIIHPDFDLITDSRPKYNKKQYPLEQQKTFEKQYTNAWLELKLKQHKESKNQRIQLLTC